MQRKFSGAHDTLSLFRIPGADNRASDSRIAQGPSNGHLTGGAAVASANFPQFIDKLEVFGQFGLLNPPVDQAPKPTEVICRSELPSLRVFIRFPELPESKGNRIGFNFWMNGSGERLSGNGVTHESWAGGNGARGLATAR